MLQLLHAISDGLLDHWQARAPSLAHDPGAFNRRSQQRIASGAHSVLLTRLTLDSVIPRAGKSWA